MSAIDSGSPIESPAMVIGRRSLEFVDHQRADRRLAAEVWYPAVAGGEARSVYEVLPGVSFRGVTALDAPAAAPGQFPLVLVSHGRTGTRISYSLLCEALAARGAVVLAPDHPGDVLLDWLGGSNVDDRANEVNRVGDANFLLDAFLSADSTLTPDVAAAVDPARVAVVGHSYGAYTAFATAAGARGVPGRTDIGAVIGLQPYVRSMSPTLLARMVAPFLLVVGETDEVTPAETDANRAWDLAAGRPAWRLDLLGAGHQASSDIALYAELVDHVPNLPPLVREYLVATAAGTSGEGIRPWRDVLADQVAAVWAFLSVTLGLDPDVGQSAAARLAATSGLVFTRR